MGPAERGTLPGRGAPGPSPFPSALPAAVVSPLGIQDEPPVPGACAPFKKAAFASVVPWRTVGGGGDGQRDSRSALGMIHELLLALSGYPGSIFTWNKRSGLQVQPSSERGNSGAPNGRTRAGPGGGVCRLEGRGLRALRFRGASPRAGRRARAEGRPRAVPHRERAGRRPANRRWRPVGLACGEEEGAGDPASG